MAELVQTFLEDMIPEMEQMEFLGLFTKKEVSIILKRRRDFEYKLRKMTKKLNDFVEYTRYEQDVLALIRTRRKEVGCKQKKHLIEVPIVRRIHRLFGQATKRFPRDIQIWLSHVDFAKRQNERGSVTRVISKMLRTHNRQPELWIFAAKYEFEDNNDSETARRFFHRGLQFNQDSQLLWLEYYRMELLVCQKTRMRMEVLGGLPGDKAEENISDCSVALVVIKKAQETIIPNDVSFLLKFLPICRLFEFTEKHEDDIFGLLMENYSNNELILDAMARRELHEATRRLPDDSKLLPTHFRVCLETFEGAVKSLPNETMYALYMDFCLEQLQKKVTHKKAKSNLVQWSLNLFDTAHQKNLLTADMFVKWSDLLTNAGFVPKAGLILESATKDYPSDVTLWGHLLKHHYLGGRDNSHKILETFENALKVVREQDSWPLWEIVWDYSTNFAIEDLIEKLCDRGLLNTEPTISSQIKTEYLRWLYVSSGIVSARAHYKKFHRTKPITRLFFEEYIDMEMSQDKLNMDKVRSAYSDALDVYGKDCVDLWIGYLQLEMSHPQGKLEQIPMIYFKATKTLEETALTEFNHKYTMFRTGQTIDKA